MSLAMYVVHSDFECVHIPVLLGSHRDTEVARNHVIKAWEYVILLHTSLCLAIVV